MSDEVELRKTDFPEKLDYLVTVRARVGHGTFMQIDIPHEKMQEFFDRQVAEIIKLLDHHLLQHGNRAIQGAIATGGGARNPYVREKLDEYFERRIGRKCFDAQEQHPICHGALQHYPENHAQSLPLGTWTLYMCRGENYDRKLHPDAIYGNGKIRRNMVKKDGSSKRTRLDWVDDRLTTIMSKRDGEALIGKRVVMIFNVLASKPGRIKFPLFHSENSHKEHQAAYDDHGKPQPDLTKWTVRFANLEGDLSEHQFPVENINGQDHYIVTTIVSMEGDENHLDLVFRVVNEDDLEYNEYGERE